MRAFQGFILKRILTNVSNAQDASTLPRMIALSVMVNSLLCFLGTLSDAIVRVWLTQVGLISGALLFSLCISGWLRWVWFLDSFGCHCAFLDDFLGSDFWGVFGILSCISGWLRRVWFLGLFWKLYASLDDWGLSDFWGFFGNFMHFWMTDQGLISGAPSDGISWIFGISVAFHSLSSYVFGWPKWELSLGILRVPSCIHGFWWSWSFSTCVVLSEAVVVSRWNPLDGSNTLVWQHFIGSFSFALLSIVHHCAYVHAHTHMQTARAHTHPYVWLLWRRAFLTKTSAKRRWTERSLR